MPTLTAADILQSAEFFEASEKTKRYVHHRFQDYGYRLAEKLGDLQHRSIYMGLAKNEDRNLLDIALAFSLDYYDQPNKGKLFMWKLKQLRMERDLKRAKSNFEHDFVMQTMSKTYDSLAQAIYSKHKSRMDDKREAALHLFATMVMHVEKSSPKAQTKLLDLGVGAGVDAHVFARHPLKVFGFEISQKLAKIAKNHCSKTDAKIVRKKHFLEHSYKPKQFQGIWLDKFWQMIPQESEAEYLVKCFEIMSPQSFLGITFRQAPGESEPTQTWQEIQWQEQTLLSLLKTNQQDLVIQLASRLGFELVEVLGEIDPRAAQSTTIILQRAS